MSRTNQTPRCAACLAVICALFAGSARDALAQSTARDGQALINDMKVLPDFRKPDNIRIGIAPIYNSFVDVYETVARLAHIVEEGIQERYPTAIPVVT